MYFTSWQQLLLMQGHGIYVWPAYLISVGVLLVFGLVLRSRMRHAFKKLQRQVMRSNSDQGSVDYLSADDATVKSPTLGSSN